MNTPGARQCFKANIKLIYIKALFEKDGTGRIGPGA
jgi:hypothetical protein